MIPKSATGLHYYFIAFRLERGPAVAFCESFVQTPFPIIDAASYAAVRDQLKDPARPDWQVRTTSITLLAAPE